MRWTNMEVYYLVAVVTMKQLLEAESTSGIKPEDGIPRWRPTFIWAQRYIYHRPSTNSKKI